MIDSPADSFLATAPTIAVDGTSQPFVGQWYRLISTTNWEKGRIVFAWRQSRQAEGLSASEYSDEVWAHMVGGVTSQHVGRLRRVHERFGDSQDNYRGLFWSHFLAALDWDDAELWLQGAIENRWSVAGMRGQRAATLGSDEAAFPTQDEVVEGSLQQDQYASLTEAMYGEDEVAVRDAESEAGDEHPAEEYGSAEAPFDTADGGPAPTRAFEAVADLPDDLTEALELFKLAILTHKRLGWGEVSREQVLACLDGLRQLALSPAE